VYFVTVKKEARVYKEACLMCAAAMGFFDGEDSVMLLRFPIEALVENIAESDEKLSMDCLEGLGIFLYKLSQMAHPGFHDFIERCSGYQLYDRVSQIYNTT
jgi:hypothetical protein